MRLPLLLLSILGSVKCKVVYVRQDSTGQKLTSLPENLLSECSMACEKTRGCIGFSLTSNGCETFFTLPNQSSPSAISFARTVSDSGTCPAGSKQFNPFNPFNPFLKNAMSTVGSTPATDSTSTMTTSEASDVESSTQGINEEASSPSQYQSTHAANPIKETTNTPKTIMNPTETSAQKLNDATEVTTRVPKSTSVNPESAYQHYNPSTATSESTTTSFYGALETRSRSSSKDMYISITTKPTSTESKSPKHVTSTPIQTDSTDTSTSTLTNSSPTSISRTTIKSTDSTTTASPPEITARFTISITEAILDEELASASSIDPGEIMLIAKQTPPPTTTTTRASPSTAKSIATSTSASSSPSPTTSTSNAISTSASTSTTSTTTSPTTPNALSNFSFVDVPGSNVSCFHDIRTGGRFSTNGLCAMNGSDPCKMDGLVSVYGNCAGLGALTIVEDIRCISTLSYKATTLCVPWEALFVDKANPTQLGMLSSTRSCDTGLVNGSTCAPNSLGVTMLVGRWTDNLLGFDSNGNGLMIGTCYAYDPIQASFCAGRPDYNLYPSCPHASGNIGWTQTGARGCKSKDFFMTMATPPCGAHSMLIKGSGGQRCVGWDAGSVTTPHDKARKTVSSWFTWDGSRPAGYNYDTVLGQALSFVEYMTLPRVLVTPIR